MRHSIGSKQPVTKGKILSSPRGTHKEFASSKLAATARVSKGKSSIKSVPGIGRPSPSTMKLTTISPKESIISTGNAKEQPLTDIPAIPVLRSPPPFGLWVCPMLPPAQLLNTPITDESNSNSVSGTDVITSAAADTACNALVNVPTMRAGTPKLPSRPGSVLYNSLSWSVPLTCPPSRAVMPLATAVTDTSVISGPSALLRQTSQPRWPESATASPDLLLIQSSQNSGSQPEPTNKNSQVSDSSQIHGMTLKYSDDEIMDRELRGINLQTTAHQYMMESDAQKMTTHIPFQKTPSPLRQVPLSDCHIPDGQNTWLSQVVHNQPAQLLDGTPGIRLQIPYLKEFFGTMWYLIHENMFELYAIYDTIFTEIPHFTQLQPFDLVTLDTNLQEHWDSRVNHVRMHMGWIAQVADSFTKWWESAPTSHPFSSTMLTCEQRQLIHKDFVKATDFLGTTYKAYKQLINMDPSNRLDHMTNWGKALGSIRNCFKHIKTCIMSDNYFRLISGLPPAPYPECQPSQTALEQNSPEYLMSLAWLEVNSVHRLLEQSEMYHNRNATSNMSTLPTPQGSLTPVTMAKAFCPVEKTLPVSPGGK